MSSTRSRRAKQRPTVAVVGAVTDVLGDAVLKALVQEAPHRIGAVIGLDFADPVGWPDPGTSVEWRTGPIDEPSIVERLQGADVVIHLCTASNLSVLLKEAPDDRRARMVRSAHAVTTAAAAVGARHLITVTSAMVLGASPDNPVPLTDEALPAAIPDSGVVGDLQEVERVLARAPGAHPGMAMSVIRPSALVGDNVDTVVTRHFETPRLLHVRDAQTRWQFCHLDDAAQAVVVTVLIKLTGSLTVGSDGWLSHDEVERITGMRHIEIPAALATATAQRLHRMGLLPTPVSDLAYVIHPWVVSAERLRRAGWSPRYDNTACLHFLMEQLRGKHAGAIRRLDRKDAALGAAGAAVALVGTAALVRRKRRRGTP
ncbi:MAG: NAD-dependent epimerase/dehydratase family protein [Actinomycetota bacterium]